MADYRTIYRDYYGEYPKDCIIHHIDHNRENNNVSNLVCLTTKLHIKYHAVYMSIGASNLKDISPGQAMHIFCGGALGDIKIYLDLLNRIACLKVGQKQLAELKYLNVNEWHYNEIRKSVRYE